jgi:very-short-patch-repair endonuclease
MRGENKKNTARSRNLRGNQTDAERKLWYLLNNRQLAGWKFVRQEPIGPYFADFACREARLVVEVDGSQHADSKRDQVRDAFLAARGYRVLRFWNHDVLTNMPSVLDTIFASMSGTASSPRVRGEGLASVRRKASAAKRSGGEGAFQDETLPDTPPHPAAPPARLASPRMAGRGGRA